MLVLLINVLSSFCLLLSYLIFPRVICMFTVVFIMTLDSLLLLLLFSSGSWSRIIREQPRWGQHPSGNWVLLRVRWTEKWWDHPHRNGGWVHLPTLLLVIRCTLYHRLLYLTTSLTCGWFRLVLVSRYSVVVPCQLWCMSSCTEAWQQSPLWRCKVLFLISVHICGMGYCWLGHPTPFAGTVMSDNCFSSAIVPVSYTHLTLPTKRIV